MPTLLEGARVLDLTRAVSGPFCTQMLGDMGAEIIKIELPGIGDSVRAFGPFVNGESAYFMNYNRNKRGMTLALDKPEAKEILRSLIEKCDVLVENFKPGVMAKLGFDYENAKKIRPDIIYVSITGFGQEGVFSKLPAFDSIVQGVSGLISLTGQEGEDPSRVPGMPCDHMGGLHGVIGVLAAMVYRQRTGQGQYVDIAMTDAVMSALESAVPYYLNTGLLPPRAGNRSSFGDHPLNIYKTKDGYLTVQTLGQAQFERCMRSMGLDALADDPALGSTEARRKKADYIDSFMTPWMAERTTAEAMEALRGTPCGPVYNMDDILNSEYVRERGVLWTMENSTAGEYRAVGCPIRFSEAPPEPRRGSPCLGEQNGEILSSLLGYSQAEINAFAEKGVI